MHIIRNRKSKNQERKHTRHYTQIFADFQPKGVLSRDQKICVVPTLQTNPTKTTTNKWLRVHTLADKHAHPVPWPCILAIICGLSGLGFVGRIHAFYPAGKPKNIGKLFSLLPGVFHELLATVSFPFLES